MVYVVFLSNILVSFIKSNIAYDHECPFIPFTTLLYGALHCGKMELIPQGRHTLDGPPAHHKERHTDFGQFRSPSNLKHMFVDWEESRLPGENHQTVNRLCRSRSKHRPRGPEAREADLGLEICRSEALSGHRLPLFVPQQDPRSRQCRGGSL